MFKYFDCFHTRKEKSGNKRKHFFFISLRTVKETQSKLNKSKLEHNYIIGTIWKIEYIMNCNRYMDR
jgi:hypothetical protein